MSIQEKKGEYVFTWNIENYSTCYLTRGCCVESPVFCVENLSGTKWKLRFFPKGLDSLKAAEKFVSLQLCWVQSDALSKTPAIDFSLEMVDEKGSVLKCVSGNKEFICNSLNFDIPKFLAIVELISYMNGFKEDVLTLRCRMKIVKHIPYKPVACSTFNVHRFLADWYVKIPLCLDYPESINFTVSDICKFDMNLTSSLEFLTIFINLKEFKYRLPIQTSFKITFYAKQNTVVFKRAGHLFESLEEWKFPTFITSEFLENSKISSTHLEFKLECEVKVSRESQSSGFIEKCIFTTKACFDSIEADNDSPTMQNDFRNLFISQNYSDAIIRVQSEDFPVHKLVLRVRSPVFAAMFDQKMQNFNDIVNIADVDSKTMKAFLQYLYTETVDALDYGSAKKLLLVADKYEVISLVAKCVSYLKSVLCLENVCEIITIADTVNSDNLKSFGISFVKSNAAAVLPTAKWSEWIKGNIVLASDILSQLSVDLSCKYN